MHRYAAKTSGLLCLVLLGLALPLQAALDEREWDLPAAKKDADRQEQQQEGGPLPDSVRGFKGEAIGVVQAKGEGYVTVKVREVTQVWKKNKADKPHDLVGRVIRVVGGRGKDKEEERNRPAEILVRLLEPGKEQRFELANREGDEFRIVELTEEQREFVAKYADQLGEKGEAGKSQGEKREGEGAEVASKREAEGEKDKEGVEKKRTDGEAQGNGKDGGGKQEKEKEGEGKDGSKRHAAYFAGRVRGTTWQKTQGNHFNFQVLKVEELLGDNLVQGAEKSLPGKTLSVGPQTQELSQDPNQVKFIRRLESGQELTLLIHNPKGPALFEILELTEKQSAWANFEGEKPSSDSGAGKGAGGGRGEGGGKGGGHGGGKGGGHGGGHGGGRR